MKPAMEVDQTLYKGLTVLETVARASAPCGVTEIADLLGPLFDALDLETLQRLNSDVAVNGLDPRRVAADFLAGLDE